MEYGFIASKMDGTEHKFSEVKGLEIPEEYSYVDFLPKVLNQGSKPICVPCSLSAYLNWNKNISTDGNNKRDNGINLLDIYHSKTTNGNNGMTFKDALHFLRHDGVRSDFGIVKIDKYAMVGSMLPIKQALLLNGPLVGALPVYNDGNHFWKRNNGDKFVGSHAISIVGYDKDGLVIRNSWGTKFGNNGYTHIDWCDLDNFSEIWTMVS